MFNWIKNLIKKNHTLILKQEWIVTEHEYKKPTKSKTKKKKKKTKKEKYDPDNGGSWNGIV